MRGLDLEPTDTLLSLLSLELEEPSNRLVTISSEAAPELGDAICVAASDLELHDGRRRDPSNASDPNPKKKVRSR